MQFSDLPKNLQETAEFVLGDCRDHPRVVCLAELLHAFHRLKQVTQLAECIEDDCEELGAVVCPGGSALCAKHDAEWPWCASPGCRNKSYGRKKDGYCHPHTMIEGMKVDKNLTIEMIDPETELSLNRMTMEEYLKWKD